jgi:hypothetical protein
MFTRIAIAVAAIAALSIAASAEQGESSMGAPDWSKIQSADTSLKASDTAKLTTAPAKPAKKQLSAEEIVKQNAKEFKGTVTKKAVTQINYSAAKAAAETTYLIHKAELAAAYAADQKQATTFANTEF